MTIEQPYNPLDLCSDAHCVLAPLYSERPKGGMRTHGGCQHLKGNRTGLIHKLVEEIVRLRGGR